MLQGIRILDLTRLLPGGYCTLLLADLGADVVKVEAPGHGDPLRGVPGGEVYFDALHRGKRSVALRLRSDAGRRAVERLAAASDVLVEGFRPGVMERFGLGWSRLSAVNARLVYCAITGYGSDGFLRGRAGHDLNYLARAGVLSLMPKAEGTPVIPAVQVADLGGAVTAAFAIAAALLERSRTGRGRRLEVSMTDVVRSWLSLPLAAARAGITGADLTGGWPCYHVYPVRDGFMTVAALETRFWLNFCQAIGREDLGPRQADPAAVREVAAALRPRSRAEWMAHFGDRDVCVEPCLRLEEIIGEGVPDAGPLRAEAVAAGSRRSAPSVGQHTREVLSEAGLSPAEIDAVSPW